MLIAATCVTTRSGAIETVPGQAASIDEAHGAIAETVLWSFDPSSGDGGGPYAGLLADKWGNLYGTTEGGGANKGGIMFELSPPPGMQTQWTENIIWSFDPAKGDGCAPLASLIADEAGNLYGTNQFGGASADGTVFEVSPPSGKQKQWTERILWSFQGTDGDDGQSPNAALIDDKTGNLCGTTLEGGPDGLGTVFEDSPPNGKQKQWTELVLWSFSGTVDGYFPSGSLIRDKAGSLYGTTEGGGAMSGGTVFELQPPSGKQKQWTKSLLWNFGAADDGVDPFAGLIADQAGNLYGTAIVGGSEGLGTVFEVSPPASKQKQWTKMCCGVSGWIVMTAACPTEPCWLISGVIFMERLKGAVLVVLVRCSRSVRSL